MALSPGLGATASPQGDDFKTNEPPFSQGLRPVEIRDVIEMTRLANPEYLGGGSSTGRVAQFSPDGSKFVVVLRKGNTEENSNEYSLLLWRTSDLDHSPAPHTLLRLTSTSNRPAIHAVTWDRDNETILFLGEGPGDLQQVYSLDCRRPRLRKLTNSATNVLSYSHSGTLLAYTAEVLPDRHERETWQRLGRPISTELITDVLTGNADEQWSDYVRIAVERRDGSGVPSTIANRFLMPFPFPEDRALISPNGKYLLVLSSVDRIPPSWLDYADPKMRKWTRWKTSPGQYTMLRRYTLLDTKTKKQCTLLNAPVSLNGGASSEAVWMADSQSVVITNTYLPLEGVSAEERASRLASAFTVEVKVPSGEFTIVSSKDMRFVRRDAKNQLIFEEGRSNPSASESNGVRFEKRGPSWESVSRVQDKSELPEIALEEGMNLAPRIVATESRKQGRMLLLDLNPQFKRLQFAREERIRWKAKDGHEVEGGLYYPVNYVPGRRYPLVIQTHGFQQDRFEPDGPYPSAFSAQPLAGKGIMVLQAEAPDGSEMIEHLATGREAGWRVSAYEGAIDYLDGRGLVDPTRVGIMGFSRTCWYVKYALTHSKFKYAAVSVSDGIDMGYFGYVAMANRAYPVNEMDQIMAGMPAGNGLSNWIDQSPGFHVDKLSETSPVRIVASYALDILIEWEWFSMMKRLEKPVDMVVFLDGVHLLEKPWNRMISQGGNVDWFDFWLNGHEDSDPMKFAQYARWRKLRQTIDQERASGGLSVPDSADRGTVENARSEGPRL